MIEKKGAILGGFLAAAGLILAALAGIGIMVVLTAGALGPVDPEETFYPATLSLGAASLGIAGLWLARSAHRRVRIAIGVFAVGPTILILLLTCIPALLVLSEPMYRENRPMSFDVLWRVHDQIPNRVIIQIPGCEPYWLTLREQKGLLEHLTNDGKARVKLNIKALVDNRGQVTRFLVGDLEGIKLKRQYFPGHDLPGDCIPDR